MKKESNFSKYIGFIILAIVSIYTFAIVLQNHLINKSDDVTTLTICHWQLESGFRDAFQKT